MGKIKIEVNQSNIDSIMEWFSNVHTDSALDFFWEEDYGEKALYMINEAGKYLILSGYEEDDIFDLIEPKSDSGQSTWNHVLARCNENVSQLIKYIPSHEYSDREIYDIYVNTPDFQKDVLRPWYVGDIELNMDEHDDSFIILMELRSQRYNNTRGAVGGYVHKKHILENKLASLYFSLKEDISIPSLEGNENVSEYHRKLRVAKMLIALKGICDFHEVDNLALRKKHIIHTKYPWLENNNFGRGLHLSHPMELGETEIIDEVTYVFPKEETWADVMSAMGMFSCDKDYANRSIQICRENIYKTIRYLEGDVSFKRDILMPIEGFKHLDNESEILMVAADEMLGMVIAHELGHMVFRYIREDISLKESESLANWFSCILSEEYRRELIAILTRHQGDEYKDYITIPSKYKLKKKNYLDYCEKINRLLRSW